MSQYPEPTQEDLEALLALRARRKANSLKRVQHRWKGLRERPECPALAVNEYQVNTCLNLVDLEAIAMEKSHG